MNPYEGVVVVMMLVALAFAPDAKPPAAGTAKFPELKASNLESREFNLPQDFGGERNYQLEVQAINCQNDQTIAGVAAEASDRNQVLPTLDKLDSLLRSKLGEIVAVADPVQ